MKITLLLLASFSFCNLFAQTSHTKTDSVGNLVRRYFNEKSDNKIYELTGQAFRKSISADKFKSISENSLFPLGEMSSVEFEQMMGDASQYKAIIGGNPFTMVLSLDSTDKLVAFLFKPYAGAKELRKTQVASSNKNLTELDKEVADAVKPYMNLAATTGLSIGVLQDGKMYFYSYGELERGRKNLPSEHSLYEIGSISKTFTATLLAMAVNEGRIKLNDPVSKYIPGTSKSLQSDNAVVTIAMLSNHSSGLPRMPDNFSDDTDETNPYLHYGKDSLLQYLKTVALTHKPGTFYEYSNLGVATLGYILERLYNKSFEQLVLTKICAPAKMTETRQHLLKTDSARFAHGSDEHGKAVSQWDFDVFAAAGALRSSTSDLLKYANAELGNTQPALKKAMDLTHNPTFSNGEITTALGWHLLGKGNAVMWFHNGSTGGFSSFLSIHPNKKFAVVVLSNSSIGADSVGNEICSWLSNK